MKKEPRLLMLANDFMFTDLFNRKRNISKLEKFICGYFNLKYEDVHNHITLIPRKLSKKRKSEAWKEVDLAIAIENLKLRINIEVNNKLEKNKIKRNSIYACAISILNYKESDSYKVIWSTRQINFDINDNPKKDFIREYLLREEKTNEILTDIIKIDIIDVSLVNTLDYNSLDLKEKMAYNLSKMLIAGTKEEFRKASEGIMSKEESQDLLKQALESSSKEEYIYMASTYKTFEEEKEAYGDIMKEEGIEQGIQEEKINTAKNMLSKNIDIQTISEVTNLSIEEIEKLKGE